MKTSYIKTATGYSVSTIDEAAEVSPAFNSTKEHPARSDRYSFLSTKKLVAKLQKMGWEISHVSQAGKSTFNRHLIRMKATGISSMESLRSDDLIPQIIIDNSHDGLTLARIHMGVFRVISKTGLTVSFPDMATSFKYKHIGLDTNEIQDLMTDISKKYSELTPFIIKMMKKELTEEQKTQLVVRAIAVREPWRFVKMTENGPEVMVDKILKLNNISDILTPARKEDEGSDLWRVFNTIQEKLTEGGLQRLSDKGKASRTRALINPSRNIKFNKELWEEAVKFI